MECTLDNTIWLRVRYAANVLGSKKIMEANYWRLLSHNMLLIASILSISGVCKLWKVQGLCCL